MSAVCPTEFRYYYFYSQVAVHELGHVIGLNHSNVDNSVMNAIYHQSIRGDFELSLHDRREVKKAYGTSAVIRPYHNSAV